MIDVPYNLLERVRLLITAHHGRILDESFAADVTISIQFLVERFPAFAAALSELSLGQLEVTIIETNEATIMPIQNVGEL
jgi:putative IMPACT (imprinted ancient) family translation regulator